MKALVVGCGSIGGRRAQILADMGCELVLCDVEVPALDRLVFKLVADGVVVATNAWQALDKHDPDIVLVCTPPGTHLQLATLAATRTHVRGLFVEKPLALSPHDLVQFQQGIFDRASMVTMGACNMRFDERHPPSFKSVDTLFLVMGQASHLWSPNHQPLPMLLDSIHELDMARWMMGPIVNVTWGAAPHTADRCDLLITHKGDRVTHIHLNRKLNPAHRTAVLFRGHEREVVGLWPPDPLMYRREMEHFLTCVREGRPRSCNSLYEAAGLTQWALEVGQ